MTPENMLDINRLSRSPSASELSELLGRLPLALPQRPLGVARSRISALIDTIRGLGSFLRTLSVMRYALEADGSVLVTHAPTGSHVRYRADGNVDTWAARNNHQQAGKALLLNCDSDFDASR